MNDWRPSSGSDAAERRAAMLARVREYFSAQRVLAVDTPTLGRAASSDPNIDSLRVQSQTAGEFFLHTSPETLMKRLLADGYPDIYSICRVYRDGESGKRHSPEFTMIEWYRLGFGLDDIVDDTLRLVAACLDDDSLLDHVVRLDYDDAFRNVTGLEVFEASIGDFAGCADADEDLRREIGAERNAWLDLLMSTVIAPVFERDRLTVLQHYPADQAALARLCPDDPRLADRFEVFWGDMELANGYVELTDAKEQRRRIDKELEKRQQLGRPVYPRDRSLVAALQSGLPDCAGVAVGLERLQMVLDKTDDIADVMTFTTDPTDE
ncbi:MAG: EF-P lysine aminoacylase GenX [Woeseiaceae bacterium]|nr:EF-P lysine aminoacylase GenX [Woeseiaceae bacterium]